MLRIGQTCKAYFVVDVKRIMSPKRIIMNYPQRSGQRPAIQKPQHLQRIVTARVVNQG